VTLTKVLIIYQIFECSLNLVKVVRLKGPENNNV
jgi:hypothetical protein